MNFNAPTFLFFFLPVGLLLYYAVDWRYKNLVALAASLVFYAWGQLFYLPIMLLVILVNFYTARRIEGAREKPEAARKWLWAGIVFDIGLLLFFKIVAGYGSAWLFFLPAQTVERLASNPIPLGLSFITFQVISYLIDIDNEIVDSEKSLLNFSLYILLFPKIILGPITRYRDLAGQLLERKITAEGAASGARRFIVGLAKKVLIADTLARMVNPAFDLSSPNFSTGIAWLVLVGYAIQLYFDFSGYTDMAIGLGQMLGFRFVENFNYPYISRSISEFWRRWHISLSSWFRDYVFLPLEFARRGTVRFRQQTNILVVFLLTGLWHGVTLNFVIWGLIHGLALALEMTGFGRWLKKAWPPLQHVLYAAGHPVGLGVFPLARPCLCRADPGPPGRFGPGDYRRCPIRSPAHCRSSTIQSGWRCCLGSFSLCLCFPLFKRPGGSLPGVLVVCWTLAWLARIYSCSSCWLVPLLPRSAQPMSPAFTVDFNG